ncbi:hypothetical protein MU852_04175 [Brevundimonas albigilva]|uniref:hypothetical protein n=1 Tax=Brevundimonas albigilva TaxID=1312364 RepID=UPI00201B6819|nr:hypothetical protein [Brevundimonas albigilva]UQV19068.1 hypothetical protein MU852_04175 [Brevundimonas albigilva]
MTGAIIDLRRVRLEAAIEAAIALLDQMDGDADREAVCEDEGGQCDDEGHDSDREPWLCGVVVDAFPSDMDMESDGAAFRLDQREAFA